MRGARTRSLQVALLGAVAIGAVSELYGVITAADYVDPVTGKVAEIVPGAPFVARGPNGWSDPVIDPSVVGDVDIALRTGLDSAAFAAIPAPTAISGTLPRSVAEPLGAGVKIPFIVVGRSPVWPDGTPAPPYGVRTFDELDGKHVAVAAFADLDGDGYIGVTLLDGNDQDAAIERAELVPVGSHLYLGAWGLAGGEVAVAVGGPTGAPLRVALGAAAYLGSFRSDYFGGAIPDGPAVFTQLPFFPETDPALILGGGTVEPPDPYNPLELLGVDVRVALDPDPADPRYGEAFTVRLDGSSDSIDVAEVHSGAFAGFALARRPRATASYVGNDLKLRPALDPWGRRTVYEVPRHLVLREGNPGYGEWLRLVPTDRLGNVADLPAPVEVDLRATGWLEIVEPDDDHDEMHEHLLVGDSRGVAIRLRAHGSGSAQGSEHLVVESAGGLSAIEVLLPGTPEPPLDERG